MNATTIVRSGWIALTLLASPAGAGELRGAWGWDDLRGVPDADPEQVAWIEGNVPLQDARRVVGLASRLIDPEAAPLMASYPRLDGSLRRFSDDELARLAQRPPAGPAGIVHILYVVTRTRADLAARSEARAPGVFRQRFAGGPIAIEPRAVPASGVSLSFDFGPARRVLDLLSAGEQDPARIRDALESPEMAAMMEHRSQGFYTLALSWEMLATNLALAGSDEALPLLYAEANPAAFYDFADVRANLDRYRRLVDILERRGGALASQVLARVLPALPEGTRLDRRVSFFFGAGADGWASGVVAGIDLEYFKDDVDRLVRLLAHETYHVAQSALASGVAEPETPAAQALAVLFSEGTASWVAAPLQLDEAERSARAREGERLLRSLATVSGDEAEDVLRQGTAGAGPFYWLGEAMTRTIAEADGPSAVAAALPGGSPAFAEAYARAASRTTDPPVDPALVAQLLEPR